MLTHDHNKVSGESVHSMGIIKLSISHSFIFLWYSFNRSVSLSILPVPVACERKQKYSWYKESCLSAHSDMPGNDLLVLASIILLTTGVHLPCISFRQMRFYYYLEAEHGTLQVLVQTPPLGGSTLVWSQNTKPPQTGAWQKKVVTFFSNQNFQVTSFSMLNIAKQIWLWIICFFSCLR